MADRDGCAWRSPAHFWTWDELVEASAADRRRLINAAAGAPAPASKSDGGGGWTLVSGGGMWREPCCQPRQGGGTVVHLLDLSALDNETVARFAGLVETGP